MLYFRQFRIADMGCASYMIGSEGECAVIDPQWNIEPYLRVARKEGLKITHIIDTHVHADHISGNRRLAARTGATVHLHRDSHAGFEFSPLADGEIIPVGKVRLEILHTPGHTPESIMLKVVDLEQPENAPYLLSGDTLFVGDVGRPDLAGTEGATQLFHSLNRSLPLLPLSAQVFPAHLAGSLCGRNLSKAHSSTLEVELRTNPALQIQDEGRFVHYLMDEVPPHPADFERIIGLNRAGALVEQPQPVLLSNQDAQKLLLEQDFKLVDLREPEPYWKVHIQGSLNVPVYSNQFGPNVATFFPPTTNLILVADDEADTIEAITLLAGVGRTNINRYLVSDAALSQNSGFKLVRGQQLAPAEFRTHASNPVLDVREPNEVGNELEGATNIPLRQLAQPEKLEQVRALAGSGNTLTVLCNNGNRSSVAASFLEGQGIACTNLENGLDSLLAAPLP